MLRKYTRNIPEFSNYPIWHHLKHWKALPFSLRCQRPTGHRWPFQRKSIKLPASLCFACLWTIFDFYTIWLIYPYGLISKSVVWKCFLTFNQLSWLVQVNLKPESFNGTIKKSHMSTFFKSLTPLCSDYSEVSTLF